VDREQPVGAEQDDAYRGGCPVGADHVPQPMLRPDTRCGSHLPKLFRGEVRLVLPPDSTQGSPRAVPSLIKAVARAHDWVHRIATGEAGNHRAIADQTGLSIRYVSRIMQLAFLAPDITEAILEGRQSPQMTLETLRDTPPADWMFQRKQLLEVPLRT